ncbi:hypothetical protein HCN51_39295 [Nonomuraea sp. FMUSA5-5]|uniref:SAV-6107-like HEPN domain-containing protein n=1 Tax=Nonomuraea composti TaxID=2720023 RepID=A0ABX1BEV6_9ACTN|nr:hypothetical protein [Nonomuraea sp. FMUSA5-5]NJP95417.1 hypothetical protein [Nonomuraea sp. FMUSA5-5]
MNHFEQHRATGAPPVSLEATIEQARNLRQQHSEDIFRRLGRGERLTAEQLYDTLRAQTLCIWWLLVARHVSYTDGGGSQPAQSVARFVSWIRPYANDPTPPLPATGAGALGMGSSHALALEHLNRSLELIRQDAARLFLTEAEKFTQAGSTQQLPGDSTGREAMA